MRDAKRGRFDVVLVWACDRIARSTRHFLELLDELSHLGVEFTSFREAIDTSGPLGRAIVVIIGAIAELERSLIVERVRSGMRRARLEGTLIGRRPLQLDHAAIQNDRCRGQSIRAIAKEHRIPPPLCNECFATLAAQPRKTSRNPDLSPRDKGGLETQPLNPTKQPAGSARSGRVKNCGLGYRGRSGRIADSRSIDERGMVSNRSLLSTEISASS